MKYWCVLIALLAHAPVVLAGPLQTPRPLDAWAAESFARGLARSALVRELVAVLEASNVIVHIETSTQLPAELAGVTKFVTSQHGYRYLRIIVRRDLPPLNRASVLGHELQHACEIAGSAADSEAAVRTLFQGIGHTETKQRDFFETRAAIQAGRQVYQELLGRRSRAAAAGSR
ncbi:MAG: hypothetical protein ABI665_20515 [Vicinamibacterales bacterium]